MLEAREILRLKYEVGLSLREIAKSCAGNAKRMEG
jgi:DNA-directed RNA polymerase specialized sigma24 family protein